MYLSPTRKGVIILLWLAGWGVSPVFAQQSCDPLSPPTSNVIDVYPGQQDSSAPRFASSDSRAPRVPPLLEVVHYTPYEVLENAGVCLRCGVAVHGLQRCPRPDS